MKWDDYCRELLCAENIEGEWTGTIAAIERRNIEKEGGGEDLVPIITFAERRAKWAVPQKINRVCLKAMFGVDDIDAVGHRVTLVCEPCTTPGILKGKPSIRVKGSPELDGPLTVTTTEGRPPKPVKRTLVRTDDAAGTGGPESPQDATAAQQSSETPSAAPLASNATKKRLNEVRKAAGWTVDELREYVVGVYGVSGPADLTDEQVDGVAEYVEANPTPPGQGTPA